MSKRPDSRWDYFLAGIMIALYVIMILYIGWQWATTPYIPTGG